jgi:ATP-binding cassette, subfamily B, multidrug efflux pump
MPKTASQITKDYLRRHKKMWLYGIITVVLTTVFTMAGPWILKDAINALQEEVTPRKLLIYAGVILLITIIQGVFRYFMRQTMIVASRKIEYEIRSDLFEHILTLDRQYFDKIPTGDIMARMTNDLLAVRAMVGPGIMYFIQTTSTFILALILMLIINLKLTIIAFVPLPIISLITYFLGKEVHKRYTAIQAQYSTITTEVQENLAGIRVVKAYVQEDNAIDRFAGFNRDYIKKNLAMIKVWGLFFPVIFGLSSLAMAMVLWIGGDQVIDEVITLGDLVAFSSYLMLLMWPMAALGWVLGLYQRGMASMERIAVIFNSTPVVSIPEKEIFDQEIEGKIEFKKLDFGYNSHFVVKDIDLTIEPGQTVAIVGHTGSGKSSLVSLIPRLYPIPEGMLYIDGRDINHYKLDKLRSQIGYVAQETILFSQTIEDNIAFGSGVPEKSTRESAAIANISGDIEGFPEGYETMLGERGITLSGGQKQRTALARALAINPKILILDDVFSSVDTSTEEQILQNLRQVFSTCTTLIISHRVSTVKNSDLIIVLKDGRIVEKGTHDQLLEAGGIYAELHERQLLKQELESL